MDIPETGPDAAARAQSWHDHAPVSSNGSGASQPASRNERNTALDRMLVGNAMAQLSNEHRAVVRRSYYQGWTTAEIAADLGIAEDAVKLRLHHALRALRRTLLETGVAP